MARKGENIYKRKDGRYEGRYIKGYGAGKKPIFGYVYARKYAEVKSKLLHCKEMQARQGLAHCSPGDGTTRAYCAYWLEEVAKPRIKASSYGCYRRMLAKHILPLLGECALQRLEKSHLAQLQKALQEKGLSASTVRDVFQLLHSILRQAALQKIITANPCESFALPSPQRQARRGLSPKERQHLIQAVSQMEEEQQLEVLLPLFCGLRVGELCALQYRDINLRQGVLHIRHTVQRVPLWPMQEKKTTVQLDSPKSHCAQREIPIPKVLLGVLERRKGTHGDDCFLLGGGTSPVEPRRVQRHFHKILKTARLGPAGPHILRHTFATNCLEQGGDIATISELLGHSQASITYQYLHSFPEKKQALVQKLCALA